MSKIVSLDNIALFFLAVLIAVGGVYAYKLMSILMPVIALILLWMQRDVKSLSFFLSSPLIFLFLLLLWGGVSILWAENPKTALTIFMRMSLTFTFSLILISTLMKASPDTLSKIYTLLKIAGFILICFILFQNVADELKIKTFVKYKEVYYVMKPSGSILGLGAFISCGLLWVYNSKILALATFILLVLLIYLTRCQTAFYGVLFATLVFIVSYAIPFWSTRMALFLSYTFLILSPLLYLYVFPLSTLVKLRWILQNSSLFHRLLGWEFLSEKFVEHPLLGWGLGSTPYLPVGPELAQGYGNVIHPHNNGIQAYVELGIVGGVLFGLFFASCFWLVEKHVKDRLSVAVCNATLVFGFIQAEVTHSLWHNHWVSWVAVITGLMIIFLKAREAQLRGVAYHSKQAQGL